MDVVGMPLEEATALLAASGVRYTVQITQPYNRSFSVNTSIVYVLRQHFTADGDCSLLAAAMMGKEVL